MQTWEAPEVKNGQHMKPTALARRPCSRNRSDFVVALFASQSRDEIGFNCVIVGGQQVHNSASAFKNLRAKIQLTQ
jgi:hypothetical protein